MTKFCPNCEEDREYRIMSQMETLPVRGEALEITADICRCDVCGEDIFDKEHDSVNLERAYALYRTRHGLLAPDDIRAIRERYGLSQRGMSRLLGWGEITLHRYESGALPDRVHNDLLTMVATADGMRTYLDQHSMRIPTEEARAVRDALASAPPSLRVGKFSQMFEVAQQEWGLTIDTGYRRFNMERLKHMVLFLTEGGVWTTKLNKLLWYSDFLTYRRTTCSLSGLAYQRYTHGPMPFYAHSMLDALSYNDVIQLEDVALSEGVEGTRIYPRQSPDLRRVFTEGEIHVLHNVREFFQDYTSRRISDYARHEKAWLDVPQSNVIPYVYARELSLQ